MIYKVKKDLKPKNLLEISENQISDHWKLYEGYVSQVNKLNEELHELRKNGQVNSLIYSDRRRRYGFEYNGMILHEYYFENLKSETKISIEGQFHSALIREFGSLQSWQEDFLAAGRSRGIGWTILYIDTKTNNLINNFISEHENGHISGFSPILVMDVWEHAYMIDYKIWERDKYIETFLKNVNWKVIEKRFEKIYSN